MIAQAYSNNESYNSMCFLIAPPSLNHLPTGFRITNAYLENEHLKVEYMNNSKYNVQFYISGGNLFVKFEEGGTIVSTVDLGNVMGPQGIQGETGPQGPQGPQGPAGEWSGASVLIYTDGAEVTTQDTPI